MQEENEVEAHMGYRSDYVTDSDYMFKKPKTNNGGLYWEYNSGAEGTPST